MAWSYVAAARSPNLSAERAWRIVDWFARAALRSGAPLAARLLAHAVDEALRTKGVEHAT